MRKFMDSIDSIILKAIKPQYHCIRYRFILTLAMFMLLSFLSIAVIVYGTPCVKSAFVAFLFGSFYFSIHTCISVSMIDKGYGPLHLNRLSLFILLVIMGLFSEIYKPIFQESRRDNVAPCCIFENHGNAWYD